MLPHVIRHNGRQVDAWYRELVQCSGVIGRVPTAEQRRRRAGRLCRPTFPARPAWLVHLQSAALQRDAVAAAGRRRRQAMDRQIQPRRTHGIAISSGSMKQRSKIRRVDLRMSLHCWRRCCCAS